MTRFLPRTAGIAAAGLAVAAVIVLAGMRAKSPQVLSLVRRMNRAVFNPMQMRSAGTPGAYASIVRHTGRTSGRAYATPVGAVAVDGGFVIPLPYGTQSDWLRNVLAAGEARIVHEGRDHAVEQPRVVPLTEALDHFPDGDRAAFRVFNVNQCLLLRTVDATGPA